MMPFRAGHQVEHGANGGTNEPKPAILYFLPLIVTLIIIGAWLGISGYTGHRRAYQPPSTYVRPVAPSLVPETEKVQGRRTSPDIEHYGSHTGSDGNSAAGKRDVRNQGKTGQNAEEDVTQEQEEGEETPPERTEEGDPILVQ